MSMGAPLGVDVTGNSANAEKALDNVGKKLDQVKTKAREATLAAKDMNAEMAKQLRTGAIAARGTAGAAGMSAIGGGLAAGGMMGGMAAAAGAAATVMTIVKRFGDLMEESARRRLGYEQEIADSAEKAKDARGASAERGMGQEQAYRKAMFAGGPQAIARADQMIAEGVDPADAYAAAADSQGAAGTYGNKKIGDILAKVANRGGDVKKAAEKLKNRPWMAEGDTAASDLMGLRPGEVDGWADYNLGQDPFLKQAKAGRALRGQRDLADRGNVAGGAGLAGRSRELAMASNPEGTLRADAIDKINKGIEGMEKLADAQTKGFKLLADIFTPGGSFETQLIRAMRDRDRAIQGDP
jgi:hypothetical protein